jgi:hypothetical protein
VWKSSYYIIRGIKIPVGFGQILEGNRIHTVGNLVVQLFPGVPGITGFFPYTETVRRGAVYRNEGAFNRTEYVAYLNPGRGFRRNIAALGSPAAFNDARFSQRDKKLFEIPYGNAGTVGDRTGTDIIAFRLKDEVQKSLE